MGQCGSATERRGKSDQKDSEKEKSLKGWRTITRWRWRRGESEGYKDEKREEIEEKRGSVI